MSQLQEAARQALGVLRHGILNIKDGKRPKIRAQADDAIRESENKMQMKIDDDTYIISS